MGWYKRNGIDRRTWGKVREVVLARDNYECQLCRKTARLEIDHIKRLVDSGSKYGMFNLRALCRSCHFAATAASHRAARADTPAGRWRDFIQARMDSNNLT